MATSLLTRIKRLWRTPRSSTRGFTLLELLVVTLISGGIIAGLTFIVVELMGADQRESSRSETQREMQMALDYISADLREAVYVYTGDCLAGVSENCSERGGSLVNYLPTSLTDNSTPVLAFWKQQPFPDWVRTACATNVNSIGRGTCIAGHSYALVVYSLSKSNPSGIWRGKARITRYTLTEFGSTNANGNGFTQGYANPGIYNNFDTWPIRNESGTLTNLQNSATVARRPGRPTNNPQVLVDFVDDRPVSEAGAASGACPEDSSTTGADFNISPRPDALTGGFANVRSFYTCVGIRNAGTATGGSTGTGTTASQDTSGLNQDVVVYLRGNANGRPGVFADISFLPTLETRVLSRGVLRRLPGD